MSPSTSVSTAPPCWRPIVDGPLRRRARTAATAMATALASSGPDYDLGPAAALELGDGDAGLALTFDAFTARDPAMEDACAEALDRVALGVAQTPFHPWLLGGTCGLAWVWHHLDAAQPEVLDGLDQALATMLAAPRWDAPLGLLDGLAGVAVLLLERAAFPVARAALGDVVRHLEDRAEHSEPGACWRRSSTELDPATLASFPRGYVDLGMLRGTAGLITTLCRLHAADIERPRVATLVESCVRWLQAHADGPRLPAWIADDQRGAPGHGWCSGGLGLGIALLAAAEVMDDRALTHWAVECMLADATFEPDGDLALCHGGAGLIQLTTRAFHQTGDPRLASRVVTAVEGLTAAASDRDRWPRKRGLLVGRAGTALALLAASEPHEPAWDRLLLASSVH